MYSAEKEYEILENIYNNQPRVRQRELAKIAELSLGMTNAVLKRLMKRGWLAISKLNNRNIKYFVTAEGIQAITKRSYGYVKRTIKNIVYCKEVINNIILDAVKMDFDQVILIKQSDLDFIIKHLCHKHYIKYIKVDKEDGKLKNIFSIYSESYDTSNMNNKDSQAF